MADLRTRFIEDYAGGLLNIARQELSSTGEVLAQDGFVQGVTLFVEDGRGVKSGLRLGDAVAECVDPTTETGIVNVRSADRTYAKVRDLKAFATAVASAQGALTESVTESFTNLEGAFESLENDVQSYRTQLNELVDSVNLEVDNLFGKVSNLESAITRTSGDFNTLESRVINVETTLSQVQIVTREVQISGTTPVITNASSGSLNLTASQYYSITEVRTNVPAWVTIYTDASSRGGDTRAEGDTPSTNSGVVLDVVTTVGELTHAIVPLVSGLNDDGTMYIRAVNKAGSDAGVTVTLKYIPL